MTTQSAPNVRRRIAGERTGPPRRGRAAAESISSAAPEVGRRLLRRFRPVLPRRAVITLAVLLAVVVTFDVLATIRLHSGATTDAAITARSAFNAAPAQAEKAAEALLSFDTASLQTAADAAEPYLTSSYAERFQRTVDDFLARPAKNVDGRVRAEVKASGVISATPAEVDVLLFVDQTTTRADADPAAAPQTALNRVVLTMVRSGDRWLVDDVTAL